MTYQTAVENASARMPARGQITTTAPFLTARRALTQLGGLFARIGRGLVATAEVSARAKQIDMLHKMSDRQLADMGLRRDQIASHVFRDMMYL